MPVLTTFVRANQEFGDRFVVVGIDQREAGSIDAIRRLVALHPGNASRKADLLPVLVAESGKAETYQAYRPRRLGDMLLLDPAGTVVADGDLAFEELKTVLERMERSVARLSDGLARAKTAGEVESGIVGLAGVGALAADAAMERFAAACPPTLAPFVSAALARIGRHDLLVAALSMKEAPRRKAALLAWAERPSREGVDALLDFAERKGTSPEEARLAFQAAVASDPGRADLVVRLEAVIRRADIPGRAACMTLLGRIGTARAKERLVAALAADAGKAVRVAAAGALGAIGGADARQALERAVAEDKAEEVKVAARKALETLAEPRPPAGK